MKLIWIILAILYVLSPVDLIPEALLGSWGWLEDLVLLFFVWNYLRGGGNPLGMFRYGRQRPSGRETGTGPDSGRRASHEQPDGNQAPRDPYEVLGVSRESSPEEIKTAYRELAAKYHPDKVQHLGHEFQQLAERRFKEIQDAYRRISMP